MRALLTKQQLLPIPLIYIETPVPVHYSLPALELSAGLFFFMVFFISVGTSTRNGFGKRKDLMGLCGFCMVGVFYGIRISDEAFRRPVREKHYFIDNKAGRSSLSSFSATNSN